jgi:hypothetical protein
VVELVDVDVFGGQRFGGLMSDLMARLAWDAAGPGAVETWVEEGREGR